MVKCFLIKDDKEIPVVAIHFAKQIVYYDDEPGEMGNLLYTTRYPLSKATLKFVSEGEEDGEFCVQ